MSTLLKLGLSGYDEKPRIMGVLVQISPTKSTFPFKTIVGTRHLCQKVNPTSIFVLGGGGGCTVSLAGS